MLLDKILSDSIDWQELTPEVLKQEIENEYKKFNEQLDNLQNSQIDNYLMFYHDILQNCGRVSGIASHLNSVRGDIDYSSVQEIAQQLNTDFEVKLYQNDFLKQKFVSHIPQQKEEERFQNLHSKNFRKQPKELLNQYNKLSLQFCDNIKDDQKSYKLTLEYKDEYVKGLLPNVIDYLKKGNQLIFDTTQLVQINVMQYCQSEFVRSQYWKYTQNQALQNTENVELQLKLKQRIGEFYGFKSICEYNLEERMASSVEIVKNFILKLRNCVSEKYKSDIQYFEKKYELEKMMPWNLGFYQQIDKKSVCDCDIREFKQYLEFDSTIKRFFEFQEELYQVSVKQKEGKKWHDDVRIFQVQKNGKNLGSIHCDFMQREGKRPGAWCDTLGPHTFLICCNFAPKTTSGKHELEFDDLETLFHEAGHCFHAILCETKLSGLGSFSVFWDFVEVPSQFSENFCYSEKVMKKICINEKQETVPEKLLKQNEKRQKHLSSLFIMRQLQLGWIDVSLHSSQEWEKYEKGSGSKIDAYLSEILKDFVYDYGFEVKQLYRHFSHIFSSVGGYTCGYYSYFWSDVIQAHLFEHYQKTGDFSDYVQKILAPGNAKDPNQLIQDYCGEFGFDAFKRHYGLE